MILKRAIVIRGYRDDKIGRFGEVGRWKGKELFFEYDDSNKIWKTVIFLKQRELI